MREAAAACSHPRTLHCSVSVIARQPGTLGIGKIVARFGSRSHADDARISRCSTISLLIVFGIIVRSTVSIGFLLPSVLSESRRISGQVSIAAGARSQSKRATESGSCRGRFALRWSRKCAAPRRQGGLVRPVEGRPCAERESQHGAVRPLPARFSPHRQSARILRGLHPATFRPRTAGDRIRAPGRPRAIQTSPASRSQPTGTSLPHLRE